MATLRASTLIEVIVSLTVISTVMAIASMTYVNVMNADDMHRKTEAHQYLRGLVSQLKTDQQYTDVLVTENEITYQVLFVPYDKQKKLVLLEATATASNQKNLATIREIVTDE